MGTVYLFLMRASNTVGLQYIPVYPNTFTSDEGFLFTRILTAVIRYKLSQYINSDDVNHYLLWKVFVKLHLLYNANCISKIVKLCNYRS